MNRPIRIRRALLLSIAAILGLLIVFRFTRPVLLHIPSDCVCSDYSDRVQGFALLNPLRNRAPEQAADRFFQDVRSRKVSAFAEPPLAAQMVNHSSGLSSWKLAFREDSQDSVRLYYKVDNSGLKDPSDLGGEGMLEVRRNGGTWKAVKFDAIY